MPTFDAWDIVKVPFPYTDRPVRQRRPALIVKSGDISLTDTLVWVLMITSADNRSGAGDVKITDLRCAGLPSPSLVRTTKIATIETRDVESLGYLPEVDRAEVARHIHGYLAEVVVHA